MSGSTLFCCSSASKNTNTTPDTQALTDSAPADSQREGVEDGAGSVDGSIGSVDGAEAAGEDSGGARLPHGLAVLETVDPEAPTGDLEAFGKWFGDAAVVGIGEMAHRQTEFLTLRHRLTRYLIEEHDFRLVALETDWTNAENVDAYIHGDCNGDPAQLVVENLRSLWHCQTTADMVQWMCEYNAANPDDGIKVIGMNIFQPWHDGPALIAFAKSHMSADADALEADIEVCEGVTSSSEADYWASAGGSTSADRSTCLEALDTIEGFVAQNEAVLLAEMSAEDLAIVQLHVVSLRGWEDFALSMGGMFSPNIGEDAREVAMAEIFLTLRGLRYPDAKTVLMVHDLHLAMASHEWTTVYPQDAAQIQWGSGTTRMGVLLKKEFGDDYVPIGLRAWTYHGDVSFATHIEGAPAEPPLLERLLHETGHPMFVLDVRNTTAQDPLILPGDAYLFGEAAKHPMTGAMLISLREAVFGEQLSGYVFIETATDYDPL